jgi:glutathione S-transferase
MSIKLYAIPRSRGIRNLWLAGELGIDLEMVPVSPAEAKAHAGLAAINPNGRVPAIDDGGFQMFESLAINLYLAKKQGGPLAPKDLQEDAHMTMWSMWAAADVEPHAIVVLRHGAMLPEPERKPELITQAMTALERPLKALEGVLAGGDNLVGGRFTVADLNVASVLSFLTLAKADLSAYPKVAAFVARCYDRPAAKSAMAKRAA